MIRRWCGLPLLMALAALPGCKRTCEGHSPRVEVNLISGIGVKVDEIKGFLVEAWLHGGQKRKTCLTRAEAGFAGVGGGRFVIKFADGDISEGETLGLDVKASSDAKCGAKTFIAWGQPNPNPVGIVPNGCNFVDVSLVGKTTDGGIDQGGDGGPPRLPLANSKANLTITGEDKDHRLGSVVACDLDGNGADIVVAAPNAKDETNTYVGAGRVYALLKKAPTKGKQETWELSSSGTARIRIYGIKGDHLGATLACGDLNNDTYEDLVVGAPDADNGRGKVYVLYGNAGLLKADIDLGSEKKDVVEVLGMRVGDRFGASLAVADLQGTGQAFLVVGAPGYRPIISVGPDGGTGSSDAGSGTRDKAGAVFLLPTTALVAGKSVDLKTSTWVGRVLGGMAGEKLGTALAVGDLDRDGKDDLAMGGPGAWSGSKTVGVVRLLVGRSDSFANKKIDGKGPKGILSIHGHDTVSAALGQSLAMGDVDAVPTNGVELVAGDHVRAKVWVFTDLKSKLVKATGASTTLGATSLFKARYRGPAGSGFATSLTTIKRSDSGTAADLLVGAPSQGGSTGAVYWLRRSQGLGQGVEYDAATDDLKLLVTGAVVGDRLGDQVSGGWLDPNEYVPDILMAAPLASGKAANSGVVYGVLGKD